MAKSPQLDSLLQRFKDRQAIPVKTLDESRAEYEKFVNTFPTDPEITAERVNAGGVAAEWVSVPGASEDHTVIWLHGGGFVIGNTRTHRGISGLISRASGARVLCLDYRLSPEVPFPAPVEDAVAAYKWLLSQGADPKKVVFGGESAGGGLTVSVLVALRYTGEPSPAGGVCMSTWADLAHTGDSIKANAAVDPSLTIEGLEAFAQAYLGDRDRRAPLASPVYADVSGLPPLLFMVGSVEIIRDDSVRLVEKAKAAGVDATLEVWDDMPHNWHQFALVLPEGQQAVDRIGGFIRQHTGQKVAQPA